MRKLFINLGIFIIYGVVSSIAGLDTSTWEFWTILGCLVVVQINNGVD